MANQKHVLTVETQSQKTNYKIQW